MTETLLCLVFLILGIAIGLNFRKQPEPTTDKDVEKLKQELAVYKNLKESLLNDVRYWRSRVEEK